MKRVISTIKSIIWAMIGIQKKKNLIKDLEYAEKNGPWIFIIVGIIMTILFVLTLVAIVYSILS